MKKFAEEWLQTVINEIKDETYPKQGLSLEDHISDSFNGGIPLDERSHVQVLGHLRDMNPTQLLELGDWGRAFYMNIFVPEEWFAENNRDMEWDEFCKSEYAPSNVK